MLLARRLALVVTAVLIGVIPVVAADAGATPKPPKIKQKLAKLQIDVAGYIETREFVDTTSDCFPGRTYTQTNTFTFETGRYVKAFVRSISVPGHDTVMTSSFSKAAGKAKTAGRISDWRTTNFCAPTPKSPEPDPPVCLTKAGRLSVALTPGVVPDDVELNSLSGRPLLLSLYRRGGGTQNTECVGHAGEGLRGKDTKTAVVTTSPLAGVSDVLPANLDAIKLFNLRARSRVRRVIIIEGPCSTTRIGVTTPPGRSPDPGALQADGDCRITGKIVLTVRAAR